MYGAARILIGSIFTLSLATNKSLGAGSGPLQIGLLDHEEKSVQSVYLSFLRDYEKTFAGQDRENTLIRETANRILLYLDTLPSGTSNDQSSGIFLERQIRDLSTLSEGKSVEFGNYVEEECKDHKIISTCIVKFLQEIQPPVSEHASTVFLEQLVTFLDLGPREKMIELMKTVLEQKENETITDVRKYIKGVLEERNSENVFLNDGSGSQSLSETVQKLDTTLETLKKSLDAQFNSILVNQKDINALELEQEKDEEYNDLQVKYDTLTYLNYILKLFDPEATFLSAGSVYIVKDLVKADGDELVVTYEKLEQVVSGFQNTPFIFKHSSTCCLLNSPRAVTLQADGKEYFINLASCDKKKELYVCPKGLLQPACSDCYEVADCPSAGNVLIDDYTLFTFSGSTVILGVHTLLADHHYLIKTKEDMSFRINKEVIHLKGSKDVATTFDVEEYNYDEELADELCESSWNLELGLTVTNATLIMLAYLALIVIGVLCACKGCCARTRPPVPAAPAGPQRNVGPPARQHPAGAVPRRHVNWDEEVELRPLQP